MKITIYELLGMVKDNKAPKKIKYHSNIYFIDYGNWYRYYDEKGNRHNFLNVLYEDFSNLNDEVEILEEEKELHANDIEFNINNDKRDCIITLDENDLGIDKLHLDNCYFYKENDKWYVKKYDFKTIKLEEEKKKPEKLEEPRFNKGRYYIKDINGDDSEISGIERTFRLKINEIIDYLKSKGDE